MARLVGAKHIPSASGTGAEHGPDRLMGRALHVPAPSPVSPHVPAKRTLEDVYVHVSTREAMSHCRILTFHFITAVEWPRRTNVAGVCAVVVDINGIAKCDSYAKFHR